MLKLNNLKMCNNITAYGFKAFIDYAEQSQGEDNIIVSTLSPAIMAEMGVTSYYAPVLPRGVILTTAEDVEQANLDVNLVTVFSGLSVECFNKVIIVSRHQGTINLLLDMYPDATVLSENVTPEDISDGFIIGTLPPHLISFCKSYSAVTISNFDYSKDGDLSGPDLFDRIKISNPITVEIQEIKGDKSPAGKEISKAKIVESIKQEYAEARKWCHQDFGRHYKMMIDTMDGRIWSDVFLSENDWKIYHSDTISKLDYVPGYVNETEEGYIEDAISKLITAGWTIIEEGKSPVMKKLALLNTSILTTTGNYTLIDISLNESRALIADNADNLDSAIGHQSTANVMTTLLGVDIPVNRQRFQHEVGQIALVFKLNGRQAEGKILTAEEIESIGYKFQLLTRHT